MNKKVLFVVILTSLISGCSQNNSSSPNNLSLTENTKTVEETEGQIGDPHKAIVEMEVEINRLSNEINQLKQLSSIKGIESLQQRVSVIENEIGFVKNINRLYIQASHLSDLALTPPSPANGLKIEFYRSDFDQGNYNKIYEIVTNDTGKAELTDVRPGDYKITWDDQVKYIRLKSDNRSITILGVGTERVTLYRE